jgi:hypothetical protein
MKFKECKNPLLIGLILACATFLIMQNIEATNNIDCSKPIDVIFLKPSEVSQASEVANNINGVVIIPYETGNRIIGRSEVLDCPNFNSDYYLNLGSLD